MHKVLEQLAKVIGRAWARQWFESLRERESTVHQSNKSESAAQDSAAKDAACSKREQ
jgi:hypothetical protein